MRLFTAHGARRALGASLIFAVSLIAASAAIAKTPHIDSARGALPEDLEIFVDGMEEFVWLHGQARFLEPLAEAQVVVSGDAGNTVTTTTDENGFFSAKFVFGNPRAIVQVRARGTGAQAHEEYASYLGDMDFLLERAGEGRSLSIADVPALRLNPFHTGLYVAMRDIPALPAGSTVPDFARRARSFSSVDLTNRAPLIALLAAGDLDLPAGAATTLEAMSNEAWAAEVMAASQQLPWECPSSPLCLAYKRTGSDPDQLPLLPPQTGRTLQGYIAPGLGQSVSQGRIRLEEGGLGELTLEAFFPAAQRAIEWEIVDGAVRVTALDGNPLRSLISYDYFPSCGCQIYTVYATVAMRLLFAEGPGGVVLMGKTDETERRYPDNPEIPTVPATASHPRAISPTVADDIGLAGGFANPAGTTIVLPRCLNPDCSYPPPITFGPNAVVNEPHRFDAGGNGAALRLGETFTWTRNPQGRLHVAYSSGTEAIFVSAALPTAVTGIATSVFTTSDNYQISIADDYAIIQDTALFSEANAPGSYLSKINFSYPYGSLGNIGSPNSGFDLFPGGGGHDLGGTRPLTWSVDGHGRLSFVRANTSPSANPLYPQRRNWELLGRHGNSIYVLESVQIPDPDTGEFPAAPEFPPTGRLLRYDKLD